MNRFFAIPLTPMMADWHFPMSDDGEPMDFDDSDIRFAHRMIEQALSGERVQWKDIAWRRMGFNDDLYAKREQEFGILPSPEYEVVWVATATLGDREIVFSCEL